MKAEDEAALIEKAAGAAARLAEELRRDRDGLPAEGARLAHEAAAAAQRVLAELKSNSQRRYS